MRIDLRFLSYIIWVMDWIETYFNYKWLNYHKKGSIPLDLYKLLKMEKFVKVALDVKLLKQRDYRLYSREDYLLKSEKNYWIPISVLKPKQHIKNIPVVAFHGHGGGGRLSIIGDRSHPDIADAIEKYNYDYGLKLVLEGYTVFCPDSRGFGYSRCTAFNKINKEDITDSNCRELSNLSNAMGMTLTGMMVWDSSRIIDYIQEYFRLDIKRLSVIGFSGGGMLALFSSAYDKRVVTTIISGYFYGFRESHLERYGNCSCNYIPELWEFYNISDIAALICPRRLFIESGISDHLNGKSGIKNVMKEIEIIKNYYKEMDVSHALIHKIYKSSHRFYGDDCIPWLFN